MDLDNGKIDPITEECLNRLENDSEIFVQANTLMPYWLNGSEPLENVNVFHRRNDDMMWWHYITCGFSDLHGDNKVHQ